MIAAVFPRDPVGVVGPVTSASRPAAKIPSIVTLIDRRTGLAHRVNGSPLALYTLQPEAAAADLLEGRDAAVWEVRIERFQPGVKA